jgi:hypothetical protein
LAGIVLRYEPRVLETTFTVIVHVEPGAIVPLFSVTELPPLTALKEAEPPQPVNVGETGLARKTLTGRLSVREAWVSVVLVSVFVITMVSWLVCPTHTVFGEKLLLTVGVPATSTRRVALAGVVFVIIMPPPSVAVNAPAGMVLMRFPGVVEVTSMDIVQDPGFAPA